MLMRIYHILPGNKAEQKYPGGYNMAFVVFHKLGTSYCRKIKY